LISRLRGIIESVSENRVEVSLSGIFYEVLIPTYLEQTLRSRKGDEVELFIQHYLEGGASHSNLAPRLVGFLSKDEREFYVHLIKVPGLGQRSVLKSMVIEPARLAEAIEREDKIALSNLPGVGKRTADKIIATLKGKVSQFAFEPGAAIAPAGPWGENEEEAVEVLIQLSYKRSEAEQLVARAKQKSPELDTSEAMGQAVLKEVGSGVMR